MLFILYNGIYVLLFLVSELRLLWYRYVFSFFPNIFLYKVCIAKSGLSYKVCYICCFIKENRIGNMKQFFPTFFVIVAFSSVQFGFRLKFSVVDRQRLIRREAFSEENWKKIYFLSNGNGTEIRGLVPFMR